MAKRKKKKKKAQPVDESSGERHGACGVCKKKDRVIAISDFDSEWEDAGHPDHISRDVCVDCAPDYRERDECATLVYSAMKASLEEKGHSNHEIEQGFRVAFRSIDVDFDDKSLVKLARLLKVKHPWLKGKRAK